MVCVTYTAVVPGGTQPSQPSSNMGLILGLALAAVVAITLFGGKK